MKKIENFDMKAFIILLLVFDIMVGIYMTRLHDTVDKFTQEITTLQRQKTAFVYQPTQAFLPLIPASRPVVVASNDKPVEIQKITPPEKSIEDKPIIKEKPPNPPDNPIEVLDKYIDEICARYNNKIKPELVKSVIYQESRGNPMAKNGDCLGLMQVSTTWHSERAAKLGVTDFYDSYGNILLGVDYLNELFDNHQSLPLALMLYSMRHDDAFKMYSRGQLSTYAEVVLARAETYKKRE
jgi:hypothetical protein